MLSDVRCAKVEAALQKTSQLLDSGCIWFVFCQIFNFGDGSCDWLARRCIGLFSFRVALYKGDAFFNSILLVNLNNITNSNHLSEKTTKHFCHRTQDCCETCVWSLFQWLMWLRSPPPHFLYTCGFLFEKLFNLFRVWKVSGKTKAGGCSLLRWQPHWAPAFSSCREFQC